MSKRAYPGWVTTQLHKRMHDDFRIFLWWLWKQLGLPEPTQSQYEIAYYLQRGPKRRIVMAFRGIGKSWITAAFVLWCLMRNPDEKIMVVSASEYKAIEFSTFTKQLIETIDLFACLRIQTKGQRDSVLAFDVGPAKPAQAPSVRAVGVGGQMTGGRATKLIFDDIEVPNNSETEGKREKLENRSREMGGAILVPGGDSIGLGTPQSIQTVYNGFEGRGYTIRIWPARYPSVEDLDDTYGGRLHKRITDELLANPALAGTPVDPARFDEKELREREAEYGRSGFALQFMLNTTLSDANKYPLKFRDMIVMDIDKDVAPSKLVWASGPAQLLEGLPNVGLAGDRFYAPMHTSELFLDYEGSAMFIDPSGRGKDETAYAVVKSLNGYVFVRRWGGLSGGYDEATLRRLAEIAQEESVNFVATESNFGDGMFNALFAPVLQDVYPVALEEYKVTGQKELRIIDKLEPVLNQHRLVMDKSIVEQQLDTIPIEEHGSERAPYYNGFYQLAYLTKDRQSLKQDDRIDVLAEAVGYFTQDVSRSTEKADERRRQKIIDEELAKHQKACKALGGGRRRPRFAGV